MQKTKIVLGLGMFLVCLVFGFQAKAAKLTGQYADKIFYQDYYNDHYRIVMLDKNGKKAKALVTEDGVINQYQVVGENKIGYAVNDYVNSKGYIYLYDLAGSTSLVKTIEGEVEQLTFYDQNTYAYIKAEYWGEGNAKWTLYCVYNGVEKKLRLWQGKMYGRGGWYEDDNSLAFSADGQRILHIATSSIRDSSDYTTYIFDLAGHMTRLKNSTHPVWISSKEIVYHNFKKGYLWKYNIKTKKSAKIKKIAKGAYNPRYLPEQNKITFWTSPSSPRVYVYNLTTKKLQGVTKKTQRAVFPEWVNESRVVVFGAEKCTSGMCPLVKNISLFNLKNKKMTRITKDTGWQYFTQYTN